MMLRDRNLNSKSSRIVKGLMRKNGDECYYCGRKTHLTEIPYATIDHVIPKGKGGKNIVNNRELSCLSCNSMKGDMSQHEFENELRGLATSFLRKNKMIFCGDLEKQLIKEIDKMEKEEKQAYMHGAAMAAEYTREIGVTDMSRMTPEEILTFCECMCKNYHMELIKLQKV